MGCEEDIGEAGGGQIDWEPGEGLYGALARGFAASISLALPTPSITGRQEIFWERWMRVGICS